MDGLHLPAQVYLQQTLSMGEQGLREPFGWPVAGLPPAGQGDGEIRLTWPTTARVSGPARLRITVLDTREPQNRVEVRLARSGRVIGAFDIRWAAHLQVFEVPLNTADAAALVQEGACLRPVEGTKPLWVLISQGAAPSPPPALCPHLLLEVPTDRRAEFFARLASPASVQSFGWMEGCVLDGLRDLAKLPAYASLRSALHQHLELFFRPDGNLIYESYHCQPSDNKLATIEATLPFAALCQEFPKHPALRLAQEFWEGRADAEGCIQDGGHTSAEGSYTVGYPLAVLAKALRDETLGRSALLQVRLRHQRLFNGSKLPRWRTVAADGSYNFGNFNWARGIAWQLLGTARTLRELEGWLDIKAAREEFTQLAQWARGYQEPDGLWSVFVDEPDLLPDTSGSAGIAAALAIGVQQGWLDDSFQAAARRTNSALDNYLTPDGFLFGASQSNKGGEELQRAPYRPIYQMGMGLMAQLIASLETTAS